MTIRTLINGELIENLGNDDLLTIVYDLLNISITILDRWEEGDLAEAVRDLHVATRDYLVFIPLQEGLPL